MGPTVAIIAAGGSGSRLGLDYPKQFCLLNGIPLLVHTLRVFQESALITEIIAVTPRACLEITEKLVLDYGLNKVGKIIPGGTERQDSVKKGLDRIPEDSRLVVVHDAARPLVKRETIEACISSALENRAAIAALTVKDTIKETDKDRFIERTVDRSHLWQAQTPQVMEPELLRRAFREAEKKSFRATDEASLLELTGVKVKLVEGSACNIKITEPEDLVLAESILMRHKNRQPAQNAADLRIGQGYDAHRLVEGRDLVLGGVTVPHDRGLLGHSDADVLTHALCDAILGALGLGDLGRHFPDSDPAYRDISSLKLLEKAIEMAAKQGYGLSNCDLTVISQEPKLSPWFNDMRENLATACRVNPEAVNIKATTTESMGFTGRGEGISAHAAVLLQAR
ncbi:MAG: 2-C-methyl-D-erythritol 4-phosphate cytidylyltransferase [Thermodesulfobacteriota bacterium]